MVANATALSLALLASVRVVDEVESWVHRRVSVASTLPREARRSSALNESADLLAQEPNRLPRERTSVADELRLEVAPVGQPACAERAP